MDITVTIPMEKLSESIDKAVENLMAKDWQPVVHAKWEICSDGYYPYCSNCKNEPKGREMTDYCPNCGARMDGKELSE